MTEAAWQSLTRGDPLTHHRPRLQEASEVPGVRVGKSTQ